MDKFDNEYDEDRFGSNDMKYIWFDILNIIIVGSVIGVSLYCGLDL